MSSDMNHIAAAVRALLHDRFADMTLVDVEPAQMLDGYDYLLVKLRPARSGSDPNRLISVVEAIEERVADLDERYPSVRFLEAA